MAAKSKLTLGTRKLLRILETQGIAPYAFARSACVDRLKLARVLSGETKRVDVDFATRCVRALPAGSLRESDFASWTVDEPDSGAEVQRKLRAVAN